MTDTEPTQAPTLPADVEPLLTARQVMAWLGINSTDTLLRLINAKGLPYVALGAKSRRFRRSDIERWLALQARVQGQSVPASKPGDSSISRPAAQPAGQPLPCWSGKRRARRRMRPAS